MDPKKRPKFTLPNRCKRWPEFKVKENLDYGVDFTNFPLYTNWQGQKLVVKSGLKLHMKSGASLALSRVSKMTKLFTNTKCAGKPFFLYKFHTPKCHWTSPLDSIVWRQRHPNFLLHWDFFSQFKSGNKIFIFTCEGKTQWDVSFSCHFLILPSPLSLSPPPQHWLTFDRVNFIVSRWPLPFSDYLD